MMRSADSVTERLNPPFAFDLRGRYMAVLSVFPYFALGFLLLCVLLFLLVMLIVRDFEQAFRIVFLPYLLVSILLVPLGFVCLYMIRWHGTRRLEVHEEGLVLISPRGEESFVHWGGLSALELRFAMPSIVQCTLIAPGIRFSFSNLELNLERRLPLTHVFKAGFDMERMRQVLQAIGRMAPKLRWRATHGFQERFHIYHPPRDLERLR